MVLPNERYTTASINKRKLSDVSHMWTDTPPEAIFLLTQGDFDRIFHSLKYQSLFLLLFVIFFDIYLSCVAGFSSIMWASVYTCTLCNIFAKYFLLAVIHVDTQACIRSIDTFSERYVKGGPRDMRLFAVTEYKRIRKVVLDISDRTLYLYITSTCMIAVQLLGAYVLLFIPFRVDDWIVFVFLLSVELSFNLFAVKRISKVNMVSEALTESILEADGLHHDNGLSDFEADRMAALDGSNLMLPKSNPLQNELNRLSLSVICLSKPIVFASVGIVWTDTKFRYQVLAYLTSFVLFMSKYIFNIQA
jgi:hypothetical protein